MTRNPTPARIFIVDDHPLVREGLNLRISAQTDMVVCGEAGSEEEAYAAVLESKPDLVIVDISLKNGNGMELIKRLNSRCHDLKMLVVSGHSESLYAERALRAGARGYVNKQESNSKLLDAIRTIVSGERFVSPEIAQRLIGKAIGNRNPGQSPIDSLTDRELEIFLLIGKGQSTGIIAQTLFLSTHTIDTHRENIKRKLAIKSGTELNRAAVQWVLEQDV